MLFFICYKEVHKSEYQIMTTHQLYHNYCKNRGIRPPPKKPPESRQASRWQH